MRPNSTWNSSWTTVEEQLKGIYKGDPGDLEIAGPSRAVTLGMLSAEEARPGASSELAVWSASMAGPPNIDGEQEGVPAQIEAGRHRAPGRIRAVLRRDLFWTLMIAVVATAAYVPAFYGPAWGTPGNYGSAFVAGFVGKLVLNWALLPAFQSLGLSGSSAKTGETQTT